MSFRPFLFLNNGKIESDRFFLDRRGGDLSNQIIVREAADLVNIDSTKLYVIDGKIDMGTQQIEVPSTGFFCRGLGYFISSLYSTADNYTMFVNKTGDPYAGDVIMEGLTLEAEGLNSRIFNLDNAGNFGAIEFNSVNWGDFGTPTTSCGTLTNYRQFRTRDFAMININDGLEFEGTWAGGMSIFESIMLFLNVGCVAWKAGATLSVQGSFVSDINALSSVGNNNNVIFDFAPANFVQDWGFNLNGARFKGSFAIPNMPITSTKRFFADCTGVKNTRVGAGWYLDTETPTTLTQNVPAKLLGTTTYNSEIHFSNTTDNAFVYDSTVVDDFFVSGFVTLEGSPDRIVTIEVRKWDDSAGAYVVIETFTKYIVNVVGNVDVGSYSIGTPVELDQNDRIELWVINETDNSAVTLQEGSWLRVKREV